jgi:hypothetical protein
VSAAPAAEERFRSWLLALERRHLEALTFAEVRRALQALSSLYVQRRGRLAEGAALDGAGKRAAFALVYGPLHFLLVRDVVRALGAAAPAPRELVDLGCGTGVGGAAGALECGGAPLVRGVDLSGWAVEEARFTLRQLGLRGDAKRGRAEQALPAARGSGVIAAFTLNEMDAPARTRVLEALLSAGTRALVVEPIAGGVAPWWDEWSTRVTAAGGRADEWRFRPALPELVARFDRAARLDHRELTARTLWLPGR